MIAVDTSALMAIVLREPAAGPCMTALEIEDELVISAGTLTEALIVGLGRDVQVDVLQLVTGLAMDVIEVDGATARRAAEAYVRWGKGFHPANLNFGDCFAYELAERYGCPLLFIGDDFAKTDIASAL
jgi:ribonuclease VapC